MDSIEVSQNALDRTAIENFRRYLQIPSVQPNVDYTQCVEFLQKYASELDLQCRVFNVAPGKPVVVITWLGTDPELQSILLNSHMDVVAVFEEKWSHKPFDADIVDGKIYARGAQDMKCVGIQYLEAIRRLKSRGNSFKRTFNLCFSPDEEIGGLDGMNKFVKTESFRELNVGFAMDEGMTSEDNEFFLLFAERYSWKVCFHCTGPSGHGSTMTSNTAGEKATYIMNKINEFRNGELKKVEGPVFRIANVTSINITKLSGGVQPNVVPPEFTILMDCRMPVTVDEERWEETLHQWCKEAGEGVWIEFGQKDSRTPPTVLDDTNPYWVAVKTAFDEVGINVNPVVSPASSDMKFIRQENIPGIGFSPINNTDWLIHDHNEYLGVDTFLRGIEIYCKIMSNLGNIGEQPT